jgi:hypothetical protein
LFLALPQKSQRGITGQQTCAAGSFHIPIQFLVPDFFDDDGSSPMNVDTGTSNSSEQPAAFDLLPEFGVSSRTLTLNTTNPSGNVSINVPITAALGAGTISTANQTLPTTRSIANKLFRPRASPFIIINGNLLNNVTGPVSGAQSLNSPLPAPYYYNLLPAYGYRSRHDFHCHSIQ